MTLTDLVCSFLANKHVLIYQFPICPVVYCSVVMDSHRKLRDGRAYGVIVCCEPRVLCLKWNHVLFCLVTRLCLIKRLKSE